MIMGVREAFITPFTVTPEFEEVFGSLDQAGEAVKKDWAFQTSNIDCLFENIMITEDGPYCLDYEWVFSFPVPVTFIKFRILYYFYEQYKEHFNLRVHGRIYGGIRRGAGAAAGPTRRWSAVFRNTSTAKTSRFIWSIICTKFIPCRRICITFPR